MMYRNLLAFAVLGLLISCGKDEDSCTAADFAGTYSTSNPVCLFNETGGTLTITTTGIEEILLSFNNPTAGIEITDGVRVEGCTVELNVKDDLSETDFKLTAKLDGNKITVSYAGKIDGENLNCSESYTK